ncbi:hypothetical protein D3C79_635430 [compost metagenome]
MLPLVRLQVGASGVVAARVQQHDAVGWQALQARQHAGEVDATGGVIEVRVGVHLEAGAFEDGAVVVPGRVADPDFGLREVALEEVGTDFQGAGATHGLHGGHATAGHGRVIGTEQQRLDGLAVAGQAFHRQVKGCFVVLAGNAFFHRIHRRQLRHHAGLIVVKADTQVDLVGTGIGLEGFHQREDRVAGIGIDMFEHSVQLLGSGQFGKAAPRIPGVRAKEHHLLCRLSMQDCTARATVPARPPANPRMHRLSPAMP